MGEPFCEVSCTMRTTTTTVFVGLFMAVLVTGLSALPVHAQEEEEVPSVDSMRIGYVNLEYLLRRFRPYQDAQDEMEEFEQQLQEEIQSEEQELQQMRQQLQQGGEMLSQEERRRRQQQFRQRAQQLQQRAQQSEQRLAERQQELLAPVMSDLQEAVQAVGENRDYDVIERYDSGTQSSVIWVNERVDATQAVIDYLAEQDEELILEEPQEVENVEELDPEQGQDQNLEEMTE